MDKLVVLTLLGDLDRGMGVTVTVREESERGSKRDLGGEDGQLPPCPDLIARYEFWQSALRSLALPGFRVRTKNITIGGDSILEEFRALERAALYDNCKAAGQELSQVMNEWLDSELFLPIRDKLNETISTTDRARVLLSSSNPQVKNLPWSLWDWLGKNGRQAEVILSTPRYQPQTPSLRKKVRILIILGKSEGINPEMDLQILRDKLPASAEILPQLINPTRQQVTDCLRKEPIDILVFAGHSETDNNIGYFYINESEVIEINDLKHALETAMAHGLKLAIFNSCDGLGLAHALESLHIPNLIVMRDIVHDKVAQQFLRDLLNYFAIEKKPLHLAEREARQGLQGLEGEFPCATWMPVIFQHPLGEPQFWQNWMSKRRPHSNLNTVFGASVGVTLLIMGVRSLGILEKPELWAYDFLMRQRPPEQIDDRILVVEADATDMDKYGKPLLSDAIIAQVVDKLEQNKPRAIGLDIFRPKPEPPGHDDLIASFKKNQNLIASYFAGNADVESISLPTELSKNQLNEQAGFADLYHDDNDDVVRRQVLWLNRPNSPYAFSLLLADKYLEANGKNLNFNAGELRFGTTTFKQLAARTGGYQKLGGQSSQILLNFRSPDKNGQIAKTVSLRDILGNQIDQKFIKDKIVIIGVTAPILRDEHNTPYGEKRGLWIHTQMVSAILSAVEDDRKPLLILPQSGDIQWGDILWVLGCSFTVGLLVSHIRSPLFSVLTIDAATWFLYEICLTSGYWLPFIPSLVAIVIVGGVVIYIDITSRSPKQQ